jgi:hypothetical protein
MVAHACHKITGASRVEVGGGGICACCEEGMCIYLCKENWVLIHASLSSADKQEFDF